MSTTTSLVTLPFLALISIPLAISAAVTICFSIIALFLQLSVVSIELCYALFANLFIIPPSASWSLLSFTASEPTTPNRQQSFDYGLTIPSPYHLPPAFRGQSHPALDPRRSSTNLPDSQDAQESAVLSFDGRYSNRPHLRRSLPYIPSSGFLGLISGDGDRDFEGLGGWRCPPSSSKSLGHRSGRTSPSSSNSLSDEIDEIAWVSINSRLELPSQPLTHRRDAESSEPYIPWRNPRQTASHSTDPRGNHSQSQRHHRRSATTSMVSGLGVRSPSSPAHPLSTRHESQHDDEPMQQGLSPRSQSHTSLSAHWEHPVTTSASNGAGSYFALQPKSGAQTTSNTTPNDERKPARNMLVGGGLIHYPTGSRSRRTSTPGFKSIGWLE
ncbi:hypothetical protein P175DRAFT_0501207 [Aspergillus ochraceoroseus IBT 24754]|uniref:Uncharacterized protein n=3 Tax=Aspergillus subgen. Nidulantes TaxID=2720870 RepID=A0A0F8UBU9_9EURO|nr:uncharacterized protein P175DRAFT_0501207 [Aspergillus ochraceoroseus IBT 24754]KKK17169.1 hypothetical protein ARAM_002483 [Aspergillus rambellii]KKK19259.1 hypothetical protein AOCH_002169 [Aspergillus ochraceoroseus]PTU20582.1 hypothetical protein P175DRAFT_0501207 [Aspergillus ochraceoroseus IBT 24754]